jgi:hypothetical protein
MISRRGSRSIAASRCDPQQRKNGGTANAAYANENAFLLITTINDSLFGANRTGGFH